ncbi:hypothetical protein D3C77_400960 [compost metagenome]
MVGFIGNGQRFNATPSNKAACRLIFEGDGAKRQSRISRRFFFTARSYFLGNAHVSDIEWNRSPIVIRLNT